MRRVQAWCVVDQRAVPDDSTSAYGQARARLSGETLAVAHEALGRWIERRAKEAWRWCGRPVKVLDGCGLSMLDTAENRAVRLVRFRVAVPGFRTERIVLVTTLLDDQAYPDEAIIALYRRRWAVELCFRDISLQPRADAHARGRLDAWRRTGAPQLQGNHIYSAAMDLVVLAPDVRLPARQKLLRIIAADQVPDRPDRVEPRARKRRPKSYQLLTKPRHLMVVSPSRAKK